MQISIPHVINRFYLFDFLRSITVLLQVNNVNYSFIFKIVEIYDDEQHPFLDGTDSNNVTEFFNSVSSMALISL